MTEPKFECHECGALPDHAEHWYGSIRYWCDKCVPMSGHYEHCPDPCEKLCRLKGVNGMRCTEPDLCE